MLIKTAEKFGMTLTSQELAAVQAALTETREQFESHAAYMEALEKIHATEESYELYYTAYQQYLKVIQYLQTDGISYYISNPKLVEKVEKN